MSEENINVVRRAFDALSRGDADGALRDATDDLELDWSNSVGPAKGVYRGRKQVLEFWASFSDAFDELRWDPEEILDLDESRVLVVNHIRMRGRKSGIDVDAVGAQLWTFTDGRARSVKLYQSKAEALEAAGLEE